MTQVLKKAKIIIGLFLAGRFNISKFIKKIDVVLYFKKAAGLYQQLISFKAAIFI